jgi:antitoxin component YwqK of YwqJK toxin-antitoxin module
LVILTILISFTINGCSSEYVPYGRIYNENGIIYSCATDKPFTGRVIDTVSNKIIEYDVINGIKNGEFIIYFSNHELEIYGTTENNKNEGKWSYFYPNGKLESEGFFKNDFPHEKWFWYYPDGTIKEEGYFTNGKKQGKWILYDEAGNLKATFIFKDGEIINQLEKKKPLAT